MKSLETLRKQLRARMPLMEEALGWLWKNPETGYREWKSTRYLEEAFEKLGYSLTRAGDIPGFVTDLDTGRPGPKILVMAELDSLLCRDHPEADPVTGAVHSCGHCGQGAALLGLAASLKEPDALDGLSGSVRLCLVPAEELIEIGFRDGLRREGTIRYMGGKPEFLRRGLLDGCDMCFLVHTCPGRHSFGVASGSNGCIAKTITYTGRASHAASPFAGINALQAANLGMTAVNAIRDTFREEDHIRFHPIVTSGGTVVNSVPSEVKMESYIRGGSPAAMRDANTRVNRALAAAAASVGGNVILSDRPGYAPLINNPDLLEIFCRAARQVVPPENVHLNGWDAGCSDIGDLSLVMPALHIFCGGARGTNHGNDFYIDDPESALMDSALVQRMMLESLLSDDAAEARKVCEGFKPYYSSPAEYFAAQDATFRDGEAVTYREDGSVLLRP